MAIEKIIDINVNAQPAEEATKSLRAQLRAAQQDVARLSDEFGATSKEAIEAAKRAAELADKIGDAKALTDAFNPDAKFKALTASLSGVASGFAAVQGAMGLFGAESESVEKTLLKVQSAMALASGLQAVGESVDSFKQLAAVVQSFSVVQKISTAAQWLWNAAMAANPIGAILTAIVAVIAAGYQLIKFFMDSAEANETAMAATQRNTQALKEQQEQFAKSSKTLAENNKFQYDMAKASGASSEALRKLALANARAEEALAKKNVMLARSIFLQEREELAIRRSNGASDEAIAAQEKLTEESWKEFTKQRDNYYKQKDAVVAIQRQQAVEVRQEQTDARKKEIEDEKTRAEKLKAIRDKEAADRKKHFEDLKGLYNKYAEDLRNLNAKTDQEKLDLEKQRDLEEINRVAKTEEEKQGLIILFNEKYKILQDELDLKAKEQKQIKDNEEIARIDDLNRRRVEMQIKINDELIQAEENLQQAKKNAYLAGLDILQMFGQKNKALATSLLLVEKGLAVAQVITGAAKSIAQQTAATGAANAVASATLGPIGAIPFIAKNNIMLAKGVASTKLTAGTSIATILAQTIGSISGGGGLGGNAPSGGGDGGGVGATSASPSFNIVGDAGVNSLTGAVQSNRQAPVQAYVVAQNVTSAQSLNRNIVESATLG